MREDETFRNQVEAAAKSSNQLNRAETDNQPSFAVQCTAPLTGDLKQRNGVVTRRVTLLDDLHEGERPWHLRSQGFFEGKQRFCEVVNLTCTWMQLIGRILSC